MESITAKEPQHYLVRWTIAGALLGAAFPLLAWRLAVAESGALSLVELRAIYPPMWIVDLAPIVLAIAGAVIGVLHARLAKSKARTEAVARQIAEAWTTELHTANLELAESLESRRAFYAALTHELRSPLTAIVGFADLAEHLAPKPPELTAYLAEIYGAATAMLGMVNDLLDAAKLETGGIAIELSSVSCDGAIDDVVGRMTPLAAQKGLTLRGGTASGLASWADSVRLSQILTNLVANSIKYSESGTIDVRAVERNGAPTIEVTDQGKGITADHLEKIFEAFDSGSSASDRRDSSGLGLAISRSLIEAMDGEITAHSDGRDQGSTFRITLQTPNGRAPVSRRAKLAV